MIWKYILACSVILVFLTFLRFVQDSPIRTWKGVFFSFVPIALVVCFWLKWAYPPPPPPQPRTERIAVNKAELERTFRRIDGVERASIEGSRIELHFNVDKPISELKQTARHAGGAAAHFLRLDNENQMTIHITVRGQSRYEMEYNTSRGMISERTF